MSKRSNIHIKIVLEKDLFQKERKLFYVKSVMYLQQNLPFDLTILEYAQFLHPEKRNNPGSTSGICNLALKVTKTMERTICKTFQVPQTAQNKSVTKLGPSGQPISQRIYQKSSTYSLMMKQVNPLEEQTHTGQTLQSCVICNQYRKQIHSSYGLTITGEKLAKY